MAAGAPSAPSASDGRGALHQEAQVRFGEGGTRALYPSTQASSPVAQLRRTSLYSTARSRGSAKDACHTSVLVHRSGTPRAGSHAPMAASSPTSKNSSP
jgi:hypothetical protein